ncbi:MAG: hypothetical protein J6N92_03235 [Alloprevotella sp.]|nr:hypothetical protein [Alloprevotella sp.]
MILKLKFISDEQEGFLREIEIDGDATFLDLCKALLESCSYPDDQMTSFYICDDEWERREQVTREDMGTTSVDEDCYVMQETRLSEFLSEAGQRLEFVFDPFNERVFYGTVSGERGGSLKAPKLLRTKGKAPRQIEELDFSMPTAKTQKRGADDVDDDFYGGSAAFNDDELDLEGFEITDGVGY